MNSFGNSIFWIIFLYIFFYFFFRAKSQLSKYTPNPSYDDLSKKYPYRKKLYFMTTPEHKFHKILELIIKDKYYIYPQVNLSKLVEVNDTQFGEYYRTNNNKIDRKSVDFVLFDKTNISPILVIELDDSSHNFPDRIARDKFVDNVLSVARIPILHLKGSNKFDLKYVENEINQKISL